MYTFKTHLSLQVFLGLKAQQVIQVFQVSQVNLGVREHPDYQDLLGLQVVR